MHLYNKIVPVLDQGVLYVFYKALLIPDMTYITYTIRFIFFFIIVFMRQPCKLNNWIPKVLTQEVA
jgi:hypothetical protein